MSTDDPQAGRATPLEVEARAILEAVTQALKGEPVSDFMESFPIVRAVMDLRAFALAGRGAEPDDLNTCRQILAADMTLEPASVALPQVNIPPGTVAFALYGAIQELRALRCQVDARRGGAAPDLPWQPIATAPKDHEGPPILVYDGEVHLATRGFTAELRRAGWFSEKGWLIHPAHWMPLPAPPDGGMSHA